MSFLSRTLATTSRGLLQGRSSFLATGLRQQSRFMSMITLEGSEEIEKFRIVNAKSVLYFTAVWCPPCKVIKPVYENMAKENEDVAFGLVDVDDNSDASLEFEITAVPTFIFFDGEKPVEKMTGADKATLEQKLADLKAR
ncbi:Thioredoxin H-type [Seminavis robusta]|uniref:Thioredoxin H-type n=1 Tax=Seminavis robusta TaxID=568900 RepID=A0A9N8EQE9_9STRA|nr:Thioredoxin H-type [Seminavis robusta]|eukprot:Sro1437_g272510.1 Thioredoxin H-type (140) ;mRNA; f:5945-6736